MILHVWALDDRSYAVRLGAALMAVPVAPQTDRTAETDGPRLVAGDDTITGTATILHILAAQPDVDPAWRRPAAADWDRHADVLASQFSALRRACLGAGMPETATTRAAHALLRPLEDRLAELRLDGYSLLGGAQPCIADILAFPAAALSHDLRVPHDLYPALRGFIRTIRAQKGFVPMPGIPHYA